MLRRFVLVEKALPLLGQRFGNVARRGEFCRLHAEDSMADNDRDEGGEAGTRGHVGPIGGRAASVAPATSRANVRPGGKADNADESGSPGAMEDEAKAGRQQ